MNSFSDRPVPRCPGWRMPQIAGLPGTRGSAAWVFRGGSIASRLGQLALGLVLGALLSACATTRAAAPAERPPLDIPPVPPRIVEAAPPPDLDRPEPVGDLPKEVIVPPVTKPRPSSPREASRETQKPEAKPEIPPVPDPALSVPPQNTPPPPVLRTPATANAAAAERQIRDSLTRARNGLKNVDYQRLSPERKKAYDEANDFISGSEAAIKTSQLEFAKELADKAEKYAKELQSR